MLPLLIQANIIALYLILHLSLLLCTPQTCAIDGRDLPFVPNQLYNIAQKVFALIPFNIHPIQMVAQLFLLGDIVFVILLIINFLGGIIKNLIMIALMTLAIMFVVFLLANFNAEGGEQKLNNLKAAIDQLLGLQGDKNYSEL